MSREHVHAREEAKNNPPCIIIHHHAKSVVGFNAQIAAYFIIFGLFV